MFLAFRAVTFNICNKALETQTMYELMCSSLKKKTYLKRINHFLEKEKKT